MWFNERASSSTGWLCDGWVLGLVCFDLGLSGFRLEFGDGGVVFGLGVIFQNDFLRCLKADDHVFDGGNVCPALTDFFADFFSASSPC